MSCGIKKQKVTKQRGGSTASDLVMTQLSAIQSNQAVPQDCQIQADMNSLNLYQTSGGARHKSHSRSRKHVHNKKCKSMHRKGSKSGRKSRSASKGQKGKKGKKTLKSNKRNNHNKRNNRNHHVMKGGSDWISSQYSQGNINAPANTDWKNFSASEPSTRDMLMNPPTRDLAGSGGAMGALEGANVSNVGAPLV